MGTGSRLRRSSGGVSRQARTRLARAEVIQAARALVLERGCAATATEAVSERSDVPPATVCWLFSSKPGILRALLGVCMAGDDQAVPLAGRPQIRVLVAGPGPRSQLSGFAGITSGIMPGTEPVHRILVSAARSDPDAAAVLAGQTRHRQRGQARIARCPARAGALRPALRQREAATSFTHSCPPRCVGCSPVTGAGPLAGRTMADGDPHRPAASPPAPRGQARRTSERHARSTPAGQQ
jgi:AcrR family transcriptional regulator